MQPNVAMCGGQNGKQEGKRPTRLSGPPATSQRHISLVTYHQIVTSCSWVSTAMPKGNLKPLMSPVWGTYSSTFLHH